uniref:Cardiomyopathy-associated protein 5 n=1 Tax=Scophthalmus maximus TaxID=52904 RepID=A0A8D3ADX6_SCOMX
MPGLWIDLISPQDSSQHLADTESGHTQKERTSDIDYFEKFTLLDDAVPGEQVPELHEEAQQPPVKAQAEEQEPPKETATDSLSASEESFVFVTDVEMGEHLDEVFYGEGAPADALQRKDDDEAEAEARMRTRRESQRSMKESGSVLFGSEETVLTPIYISSGPPKIIDLILLEEPTAMSFMYSDLYEDAVGQRQKSDEENSEAESVTSVKSYKRRLSDSEEANGYLEKFTLKDETPTMEAQPQSVDNKKEGRMMWSQNEFAMTGCLMRVAKEDKTKTEEPKTQEVGAGDGSDDVQSATFEEKTEKLSMVTEEEADGKASEESIQEDQVEAQQVKHEVKGEAEPLSSSTYQNVPEIQEVDTKVEKTEEESQEHQKEEQRKSELVKATDETAVKAPVSSEVPQTDIESGLQTETTEKSLSEAAVPDTEMVAADEKREAEAKPGALVEKETLTTTEPSAEIKTSAEISLCEGKEAAGVTPEDSAPVEVTTSCDSAVHAVVEVTEKSVNQKERQTQVQIDLHEVTSVETTDVPTATRETAAKSQLPEIIVEADQESAEVRNETSSEVTAPVMSEEVEADSDRTHCEILESLPPEESVTDDESDKTKVISRDEGETPTEDTGTVVQDTVNDGAELILLVPKGQAVEMDIDIIQWPDKTTGDAQASPEPESACEHLIEPEDTPAPMEETKSQLELEPEVAVRVEEQPGNDLDRESSPLAPAEDSEEKKVEEDLEEDEPVFSPLRSFTPQEDLSGPRQEDIQPEEPDVEQKAETNEVEDAPEAIVIKRDVGPDIDLQSEDVGQKVEQDERIPEPPGTPVEELGYEFISKQDAEDVPESEIQRDAEESSPASGQRRGERMDVEMDLEEKVLDLPPEEELIEADYDIIDAEEESQARLAAELQGMDWFCLTCGCLLSEDECVSGEHRSHEVTSVDKAYEEIKEKLSDWISELQGRSENIEDLVSELELAYNTVEVRPTPHVSFTLQLLFKRVRSD